jgi:hypothetical protein
MSSYTSRAEKLAERLEDMGGPANWEAAGKIYATLAIADALTDRTVPPAVGATPDAVNYGAYLARELVAAGGSEQDIVGKRG